MGLARHRRRGKAYCRIEWALISLVDDGSLSFIVLMDKSITGIVIVLMQKGAPG